MTTRTIYYSIDSTTFMSTEVPDNVQWIFNNQGQSWKQQGYNIIANTNPLGTCQGLITSLSSDGKTIAISCNSDTSETCVFSYNGTDWIKETNLVSNSNLISRNSLSSDGNTLVVGESNDIGAVYVYIRSSDSTWSQQSKLVANDSVGMSLQGSSVYLSGNTLAVYGKGDDNNIGAAWIFNYDGTNWIQHGSKLISNTLNTINLVSLSTDENTLTVGNNIIFTLISDVWTQQADSAIAVSNNRLSNQTLSSDSSTLAVSEYKTRDNMGSTWVFIKFNPNLTDTELLLNPVSPILIL